MGKVKIEIYCYPTADILTKVLQKCLLSGPPPSISFYTKILNLIGCHDGNRNVKFVKKYFKKINSFRSYKGDKAECLQNCL